jgi:hypothetical protein
MTQTSCLTSVRILSKLKALTSVKSVYTFAFALLLATGTLVAFPPTNTLAADCSANCNQGEKITITGATTCSCTDNHGCTWTFAGKNYSAMCGTIPIQ